MSHGLTIRADGQVELAYAGIETPWHGLGNELQVGAPLEVWAKAAGMDWRILRSKVRYATSRDDSAELKVYDKNHVFFRSDTKEPLGIGTDKFKLVQPRTVLEFFRDLTEAAGFQLSTAGTLFGGTKFWAIAEINKEAIIIDKRDLVRAKLLLATACDGTMSTIAKYVAGQVICNNTLQMRLGENSGALQVKVTHRSEFDPKAVKAELGIEAAMSAFDATVAKMRRMAETRMSHEANVLATCALFHPNYVELDGDRKDKILRTRPVEPIARAACDGTTLHAGLDGANGTVYGWLNAVTEYIDHAAVTRGDNKMDNRLDSAWFGKGADVKEKAFEMAGAIAGGDERNPVNAVNVWLSQFNK